MKDQQTSSTITDILPNDATYQPNPQTGEAFKTIQLPAGTYIVTTTCFYNGKGIIQNENKLTISKIIFFSSKSLIFAS